MRDRGAKRAVKPPTPIYSSPQTVRKSDNKRKSTSSASTAEKPENVPKRTKRQEVYEVERLLAHRPYVAVSTCVHLKIFTTSRTEPLERQLFAL